MANLMRPYRKDEHKGWPVHNLLVVSGYLHPRGLLNRSTRRTIAALARRKKAGRA